MDQDVAESSEPFETAAQRVADHPSLGQPPDDVLIVGGMGPILRAQDVVADIEDELGPELQTSLSGQHVAKALSQDGAVDGAELAEDREDSIQLRESSLNGLNPQGHAGSPQGARP